MTVVTMTFNLDDESDAREYELIKQTQGMQEVLMAMTGRYAVSAPTELNFKGLLKYDGLTKLVNDIIADDSERSPTLLRNEYVLDICYKVVDKLEDAFYDLLKQNAVDLNI